MLMGEWFKDYKSGKIKQDYDGNFGVQCVDMANSYAQYVLNFGKGVFFGVRYAKDIFTNYNKNLFVQIQNTPEAIPIKGSLIIWNRGVAGHIAIVVSATKNKFTVLEANYDGKGGIREYTYSNYYQVLGWLIPYKTIKPAKGTAVIFYKHRFTNDSTGIDRLYRENKQKIYISGTSGEFYQIQALSKGDYYTFKNNLY